MKIRFLLCAILLGSMAILFGCNKTDNLQSSTSEQTVVTIEKEHSEEPQTESKPEDNGMIAEEEEIPEHIDEVILSSEQSGRVYIDADVTKAILDTPCIQAIQPSTFTQADVDFMLGHFFGGKALSGATSEMTKDEIDAEIAEITQALSDAKDLTEDDIAGMKNALNQLKEQRANAAEEKTEVPATTQLAINPDSGSEALYVTADLGFSQPSSLDVVNFRDGSHISFLVLYLNYDKIFLTSTALSGKDAAGQSMTLAMAKEQALLYQQELKLTNLALYDVVTGMTEDQSAQGYVAIFRQSVQGLALAKPEITDFTGSRPDLAAAWPSDEVRIKFDDQGISAIEWNNKGTLVGAPEPSKILPFESIMGAARLHLALKYAINEDAQYQVDVHVDRVTLEYALIPKPEQASAFLIVPAWNFYGGVLCKYEDGTSEEFYGMRQDICHISINAIDGSVIPSKK